MQGKKFNGILLNAVAAIAFTVIATLGMFKGAEWFYGRPHSEQKRGYTIDIAATPAAIATLAGTPSPAGGNEEKPVDILPYLQKADLKLGEQIIKRCQVCHGFEKGRPNGVGPNQYNLVGRKIASVEGFSYSDAMKAKTGIWDFQTLSDFLVAPQKVVVGTKMGFAGLKKPEERAAIIAYINKNFSDKPLEATAK